MNKYSYSLFKTYTASQHNQIQRLLQNVDGFGVYYAREVFLTEVDSTVHFLKVEYTE